MKERRQETDKRRKNFLPSLLITIFLWATLAGIIYFTAPDTFGVMPLFLIVSFLVFLFTFSILLENRRRGLIVAIGLMSFLLLRYFGIGNIINFLLIAGLAITTELYFARRQ